jgi:alkylhydroperoxidase family enzyme
MAVVAGVSEEKIAELADWSTSTLFDDQERSALRCADDVHRIGVSDEGFAELRQALGLTRAIEIVLLTSFYEAVARLVQALDIEVEREYHHHLDDFGAHE